MSHLVYSIICCSLIFYFNFNIKEMSMLVSYLRCVILNHALKFLHHKLTDGTLRGVTHSHQLLSKQMHVHVENIL